MRAPMKFQAIPAIHPRTPLTVLAASCLAIFVPLAHAQSTIEWASPADGDFGEASNWLPAVVPGALDTAVLGGIGPYAVSTIARTVGLLDLSNPDAIVAVVPGSELRIGGASGAGTILVNRDQSTSDTGLRLEDAAVVRARIVLNTSPATTDLRDAQAYWSRSGGVPTLAETGVLTGRGQWYYSLQNDGTIESVGTEGNIQIVQANITQSSTGSVRAVDGGTIGLFSGSVVSGGSWDGGDDGRLQGNGGSFGAATVSGTWGIDEGQTVGLIGAMDGDGTIVVNRTQGTGDTGVVFQDGAEVGITVRLNTSPGTTDLRDAQAYWSRSGDVPTLTETGVLTGRGQWYYGLQNHGVIETAGVDGNIQLVQAPITQSSTGIVRAVDGGTIGLFNGATVRGGAWDGGVDGRLQGNGGSFGAASVDGTWGIDEGQTVGLVDATSGGGTIVVNRTQGTGDSGVVFQDGAEVGIAVRLNASPDTTDLRDAQAYWSRSGDVPTLTEAGVLTGRGQWYYGLQNNGLIESAGMDGNVQLVQANITQSAAGLVRAVDGGTIGLFNGSAVTGGAWDGGDDGRLQGNGGSFGDATVSGTWAVDEGQQVGLVGATSGDGTIVVNRVQGSGNTSVVLQDGARVGLTVRLNASPDTTDLRDAQAFWSRSGDVPTLTETGVLTGRGQWYYGLLNDGTIETTGESGNVQFLQAGVTQSPTGVVRSVDGGTIGLFNGSAVTGGSWAGGSDGRLQGNGGSLGDATVSGTWAIDEAQEVGLLGETTGAGTIVVNRTQGAGNTGVVFGDGAEIGLAVHLNASPDSTDLRDAQAYWSRSGDVPTLLEAGTLSGRGLIYYSLNVRGTLAPGTGPDGVSLLGLQSVAFDLTPSAKIEVDAAGTDPTEHDRIAGSGSITLDGSLDVDFVDGYVPESRDQFEIIRANTIDGSFADIDIEPVGAIGPAHIVYAGDSVIVVICAADRDADGELTIFDFLEFQNLFSDGDLRADLDEDGVLTIFDFLVFQNRFAAGCG